MEPLVMQVHDLVHKLPRSKSIVNPVEPKNHESTNEWWVHNSMELICNHCSHILDIQAWMLMQPWVPAREVR